MHRFCLLAAILLSAGCATVSSAGRVAGNWGGQHIGLALTPTGGSVDYDCAAGRIDEPLIADAHGRFVARGSHTPGTGGPEREGEVRPSYPATYSGSVRGDRMLLRVDVPARGFVIGPYELRRGAEPILMRCL